MNRDSLLRVSVTKNELVIKVGIGTVANLCRSICKHDGLPIEIVDERELCLDVAQHLYGIEQNESIMTNALCEAVDEALIHGTRGAVEV